MIVRVLLFGPAADAAGAPHVETTLPDRADVAALRPALAQKYPALEPILRSGRFAINAGYATDDQPIKPNDEIALIAMVSGG